MNVEVMMCNDKYGYKVTGEFNDGQVTVFSGGKIRTHFGEYIKGESEAKLYRSNPDFVNENGVILEDCIFSSPSAAAQFVTGNLSNGYRCWKVNGTQSLGSFLEEKGYRKNRRVL